MVISFSQIKCKNPDHANADHTIDIDWDWNNQCKDDYHYTIDCSCDECNVSRQFTFTSDWELVEK
jgi:hypothetical protein